MTTFSVSPTPRGGGYRYLTFADAAAVVASARRRAAELGRLDLAPPGPLENCTEHTVELALAKPRAAFGGVELYPDLPSKIAALLYGLSKSQACYEGNKRVALLLTLAFVHENGARLKLTPGEMSDRILAIAESDPTEHDAVIEATTEWVAQRLGEETTDEA